MCDCTTTTNELHFQLSASHFCRMTRIANTFSLSLIHLHIHINICNTMKDKCIYWSYRLVFKLQSIGCNVNIDNKCVYNEKYRLHTTDKVRSHAYGVVLLITAAHQKLNKQFSSTVTKTRRMFNQPIHSVPKLMHTRGKEWQSHVGVKWMKSTNHIHRASEAVSEE